jgi:hypothetical protein
MKSRGDDWAAAPAPLLLTRSPKARVTQRSQFGDLVARLAVRWRSDGGVPVRAPVIRKIAAASRWSLCPRANPAALLWPETMGREGWNACSRAGLSGRGGLQRGLGADSRAVHEAGPLLTSTSSRAPTVSSKVQTF